MKRTVFRAVLGPVVAVAVLFGPDGPAAGTLNCPPDSVKVGTTCVDKYEATVWRIDPSNTALVKKVQAGKVTLKDLSGPTSGGATRLDCSNQGDVLATFPFSGQWTPVPGSDPPSPGVYAVSVADVQPSTCFTWFQAQQACALSGKRLLTNEEWQRAAAGTPDPGTADDGSTTCNTNPPEVLFAKTGSRSACKSNWGAFDMVGNVAEWVADWVPRSTFTCPGWSGFSHDGMCFSGAQDISGGPGALFRGGSFFGSGPAANPGVFAVNGGTTPEAPEPGVGFRCAR